jgi:hypothetical protein
MIAWYLDFQLPVQSAYHHYSCEFEFHSWRGVLAWSNMCVKTGICFIFKRPTSVSIPYDWVHDISVV